MKKYSFRVIAVLICILLVAAVPVYAAAEDSVQPRWTEISLYQCVMTKQTGLFSNAHVESYVATYSADSSINLTVTVQESSGGSFVDTSRSWSDSGNGYASVIKDIKLPSGNYRIKSVATIYSSSGQYIETVTRYSDDIII